MKSPFHSGTKNTGKRNGDEVAQVYVRIPETGGIVPLKELKGFRRVPLKSGESRRVEIKLNKEQLRYWDVEKGQFVVPKGHLTLWLVLLPKIFVCKQSLIYRLYLNLNRKED